MSHLATTTEIRAMRARAEAGETVRQIVAATGRADMTVRTHCADILAARREREREARQAMIECMHAMAAMGKSARQIADRLDVAVGLVHKLAAGHLQQRGRKPDVARRQRIIAAATAVGHGDRSELARRFGYKNVMAFNTALCACRKLAEVRA